MTRNLVAGDSVYGEKRVAVEEGEGEEKKKIECAVLVWWSPILVESVLSAACFSGQCGIQCGTFFGAGTACGTRSDQSSPLPSSVASIRSGWRPAQR